MLERLALCGQALLYVRFVKIPHGKADQAFRQLLALAADEEQSGVKPISLYTSPVAGMK